MCATVCKDQLTKSVTVCDELLTQVKLGTSDPVVRVWIPVLLGHRIPMIYTVFLWCPFIGSTEFRSDLYSRKRSDPILGSVPIRPDSRPSGIKKWSKSAVLSDTGFHDNTLQLLVSELVWSHKNGAVPSIGFFHVWQRRSDRNQSAAVIGNKRKIF